MSVDSAGIAIHALLHLIETFPQQGYFLTNKPPAVNQNDRIGLFVFGQFAEAEAKLLGMVQQDGMVEPNKPPSRLHPLAGQQAIERMHPPAEALPRLQAPSLGTRRLKADGLAPAGKQN